MPKMRQVQKNSRIFDPLGLVLRTTTKLKTMPLLAILFVCFIICPMIEVDAVKVPPTVFVNKCCRIGEKLERNTECSFGGTDRWWPVIYMILKQVYFEPYGIRTKPNESSRPQCHSPELIIGEHKTALFSNGTLYIPDRGELIEKDNFCIDKDVALICSQQSESMNSIDQPQNQTLVRKCCQQNQIYQTETDRFCVTLRDGHEIIGKKLVENSSNPLKYRYEFPQCSKSTNNNTAIVGKFNESNFDESSGNLTITEGVFQSDQYCLEHYNDTGSINVHVFTCTEYLPTSEKSGKTTESRLALNIIGCALLISVVFLITTLATGFLLPTNHHVLHCRCQTYYVMCLIVGDILLAIVQLSGTAIKVKSIECVSIAIGVHFCYLVAFFWLNAMCINIWWTFRHLLSPHLISEWGTMYGNLEKLLYFYGPIGVLLFINFALFASTARQLTCGLWKRDENYIRENMHQTRRSNGTWVADVISWAHGLWFGELYYVCIVTDLINTLQGVFIFIVIGCQPQVSSVFKQIWRSKTIQFRQRNAEGGQRNSSSSQAASSLGESITNNSLTTSNVKIPAETAC